MKFVSVLCEKFASMGGKFRCQHMCPFCQARLGYNKCVTSIVLNAMVHRMLQADVEEGEVIGSVGSMKCF